MIFKKTWRWFGENDSIRLSDLKQIGVDGIVTSLHQVPVGEIWSMEMIEELKKYIEKAGLQWLVVESLPVSEHIKYAGEERDRLIENYKVSLANLGKAGIYTVCYNFMPVIDWIRTDLKKRQSNGTYVLYFNWVSFAYFDLYILKRPFAEKSYSPRILEEVCRLAKCISPVEKDELVENIIVKTQGFVNGNIQEDDQDPVDTFNRLLVNYKHVDRDQLRENLRNFLLQVIPVAEEFGINLCIHPDDPPFPVLGLPRIVTSEEDISWILKAVNNLHNGLTFCAGSLSAGIHNNVVELAEKFASRTHFVHLRSTHILPNGDFFEASHLEGRGDLLEVIKIFKKYPNLPMRVDHGPLMLTDIDKSYNPGYSLLGRMKAMAEVSGMMKAVSEGIS